MDRTAVSNLTKGIAISLGAACLLFALINFVGSNVTIGLVALAAFLALLAPRMALQLPKSRFAISFSDAAVFLTFILYGGPAAILMSALEGTANCLLLRKKKFPFGKWMIPTNISFGVISITCTYLVSRTITAIDIADVDVTSTRHLIIGLGSIAFSQFVFSSALVSVFNWAKNGVNPLTTLKQDCLSSAITQIVGAGLAGLVFKLISFGDPVTEIIAFGAIGFAYLSYRRSIMEAGAAMTQAEDAEREKAEAERERRREAEKHAEQLAKALEKEEQANAALRKSEKSLQHAALFDSLTDLPNRKQFGDMLGELIEQYKDDPAKTFYVLFLDIRRFKDINDSLGHSVGDKVLVIAGKRFVRLLSPKDMVARLGGDEFAVILRDLSAVSKANKVAQRLRDSIGQPFSVSGNRIAIGVNIGVAPCDVEYNSPEELLRDADIAMHYAKEKDSGVAVFTRDMRERFLDRVRIENDLRVAIDRNEFSMHYQPLVSLEHGTLMGFEALLRWHHSELGMIGPNKFIPIAEESNLIIPITNWILHTTCSQLAAWQRIRPSYSDLIVSVNISGKHLSNDELVDEVENVLAMTGIKPPSLKLEITESAAMENAEHTISILNRLKNLGVQLSIDDFGTGYSSLSYLHRLPFDTLKIDRSFVYGVGEGGENSEILETIVSLAKSLKKRVIAEGIETEAQLDVLQRLGCDYGQGYLFARPQTKENAERMLYEAPNFLPEEFQHDRDDIITEKRSELPVF